MPELKNTICQKVKTILDIEPGKPAKAIADELGISEAMVLEAFPEEMTLRIHHDNFETLWDELRTWEKITFIGICHGSVLEVAGRLPHGSFGRNYFNIHEKGNPIGGHLKVDTLGSVWLLNRPLLGKQGLSVQFFDTDGIRMFAVYVGRDERGEHVESVTKAFHGLWKKHMAHTCCG